MDENPYKAPEEDESLAVPTTRQQQRRPWGIAIGTYLGISICGAIVVEVWPIKEDQQSNNPIFGLGLTIGGLMGMTLGLGFDLLRWRRQDMRASAQQKEGSREN